MRRKLFVPTIAVSSVVALMVGSLPAGAQPRLGSSDESGTEQAAPDRSPTEAPDGGEPSETAQPEDAADQTPVPVDGESYAITDDGSAEVEFDGGDDVVGVVGVSWEVGAFDAPDSVEYRVLDGDGDAGEWIELEALAGDGPDPGTAEAADARTGTEPLILAGGEQIEVRLDSGSAEVQALESEVTDADTDLAENQSAVPRPSAPTTGRSSSFGTTVSPDTHVSTMATNNGLTYTTRSQWGANEKLKQCAPDTTSANKAMVVHHTAGATNYTKAQVPGILRGILNYHTQALGWCDVGYNMLVDRYGTVYEGRSGGVAKAVVGAHASGFNTGTFGVSVMGTYSNPAPSAAVNALGRVGAWQAKLWKYDPTSKVTLTSGGGGSAKYAKGKKVSLPRIFGHRDTSKTECPGNGLYGQLSQVRTKAKAGAGSSITVPGAIGTFYKNNRTKTGTPITKQKCGLRDGGCFQKFVRGSVHWSKKSGAHFTKGGSDIQGHWGHYSWERGALGYPTGEVMRLSGVTNAYAQNFQGGTIVSKKSVGAHVVTGAIGTKWKNLGWARNSLKLPITAQKCTLTRGGCFQKFQGGSIHWTKKTGAQMTRGAIQKAWGSQKWERGRLGYPTSGQFTSGSVQRQNFEGGYITWSSKAGAKIRYT